MRIAIPTTSFAAITGAIFADTVVSSQQIIAAVGSTYDHAAPENVVLESTQGKECAFDDTLTHLYMTKVDAGILRCGGKNEVCAKDTSSSMGGRCVVAIADDGYSYTEGRRQLAIASPTTRKPTATPTTRPTTRKPTAAPNCNFLNGTSGKKCVGDYACEYTDMSKIGCGSCNGPAACYKMGVGSTVAEGSCIGVNACYKTGNKTIVGVGSCIGDSACYETGVNTIVGKNSCIGDGGVHARV